LPEQPIFYPVLTRLYAEQIARDWNTTDPRSGYVGYIVQFQVRTEYLEQFPVQRAGSSEHLEYWIPADQLSEFNSNIVGKIKIIAEFRQSGEDTGASN